ncbi:MAG: hypothetical protein RJA90_1344, partial [Bacteroidota bacterium]
LKEGSLVCAKASKEKRVKKDKKRKGKNLMLFSILVKNNRGDL